MAAGFHPFAFAQQLSSITMGQNCMGMTAGGPIREGSAPPKKKPPNPVPAELKTEALLLLLILKWVEGFHRILFCFRGLNTLSLIPHALVELTNGVFYF